MTGRFVRGSLWVFSGNAAAQLLGFAAQIALGWLLVPAEFGLYAIVISLFAFVSILKDGGSRSVLIQRQADDPELTRRVFWYAAGWNTLAACLLLAIALPATWLYDEPQLGPLLVVASLALPIGTVGSVLTARLTIDLRFGAVARIRTAAALVRYGIAVLLAARGMGVMSLVLAMPIAAAFEGVAAYALARETPWSQAPSLENWSILFGESRWLVVAAAGIAAIDLGFGVTLGLVLPAATLGFLFFASQLVLQIGTLVSGGIDSTLFPTLTRLAHEPSRLDGAVSRTFLHAAPIAVVASLGMFLLVGPTEQLLWHGKWAEAVSAAQVLAALYAMNVAMAVTMAAQRATGRFRDYGTMAAVMALWVLGMGLLGGLLTASALGTAVAIGIAMFTGSAAYTLVGLRRMGMVASRGLGPFGLAWLTGAGAAGVAWLLGRASAQSGYGPAVQSCVMVGVFIVGFMLAWRLVAPGAFRIAVRTFRALMSPGLS